MRTEDNKEQPMMISKPIPIDKKCRICKEKKLLSEFQFKERNKDKHDTVCKPCIEKIEENDRTPHTQDCITDKFLDGVFQQLDCLLALVENGVEIPDEILEQFYYIIEQDERNKGITHNDD